MATLMKVGEKPIEDINPVNGTDFEIEDLWSLIGGYVQVIELEDGELMIVDEEGLCKGLPFNQQATDYVRKHCSYPHQIVGTALICKSEQVK